MNRTCIKIKTIDQRLTIVQQPLLASGDVNSVRVEFALDSQWEGYSPSATFHTAAKPEDCYEQVLADAACIIPWEVLQEEGILYIGLRGVDNAGLVKTAAPVRYRIEKGSPRGAGTSVEPSPDVYQQLLVLADEARAAAQNAQSVAQSVRDDADKGVFQGEKGSPGDKGDPGDDYVLTDADRGEIAGLVLAALPTWEGGSY